MNIPVNRSFTIYKCGVRGSSFHGHVIMMISVLSQNLAFVWSVDVHYDV